MFHSTVWVDILRGIVKCIPFPGPQDSDDSEDHTAAARNAYLTEQQQKLAIDKERIMNDQNMVAEEKTRLLEELKVS